MKRRPHHTRHPGVCSLPFPAGLACCLLLWSGVLLPARQDVPHPSAGRAYSISPTPASTNTATIQSPDTGRANSSEAPWANGLVVNEDAPEEVDFPNASVEPAYTAADAEHAAIAARGAVRPSGFSRSIPLYCLFEVYRL